MTPLMAAALAGGSAPITAQDVVDRIKKGIGVDWIADGDDTFKIGDPSTVVAGVVTTSMATLDVLQKAVQAGANLVITASPTFYSRADVSDPGAAGRGAGATPPDPVYGGKNAFIATHNLVVFRLREHWHQRTPDPRAQGLAAAMGWTKYRVGVDGLRYELPPVTLETLASQLKRTLGTRGGIRAVGDRTMTVRRIGLLPGFTLIPASIAMLPTVDAIIAGEVQEWESATYAQDVAVAGLKKGFISIGRVVNEAPGMQVCADWLQTIVPEVPVRFIGAGDPYWGVL
ncbi:MAG: Nif3-like dinuclear metal center hexameric protein [Acidobacteria bacterium]|nr:Nif3-like dinuclear metal center hexameric protein [Acidobacteriota bacterium]